MVDFSQTMENSGLEISPIGTVSFELKGSSKTASGLVTLRNSSIHQICYKVKSNVTKIPVKISPGSKGILEPNATVELNISFDPGKYISMSEYLYLFFYVVQIKHGRTQVF